jgi:hypothetical protein
MKVHNSVAIAIRHELVFVFYPSHPCKYSLEERDLGLWAAIHA